jgi:hypothetical protein
MNNQQLVNSWTSEGEGTNFMDQDAVNTMLNERNSIAEALKQRESVKGFYTTFLSRTNAGPGKLLSNLYTTTGSYPSTEDPNFLNRLLAKQEFKDLQSPPLKNTPEQEANPDFEITPVQRFVANFMHPKTPYRSMLLYHGVGVGKTCSAIQAAEAYLDMYPDRRVYIVAPPTIQDGFRRTIFDSSPETLLLGQGDEPNRCRQCTGDTYLRLTGCLYERDRAVIESKVDKAIKRRYLLVGYQRLGNIIQNILNANQNTPSNPNRENQALQREFNYRFLIIDEAHNLREVQEEKSKKKIAEAAVEPEETSEEQLEGGTAAEVAAELESAGLKPAVVQEEKDTADSEKSDLKEAKFLVPRLLRLLNTAEGMKLLLMTATPMFNSVYEISFLLSLCLINDNKPSINWAEFLKSKQMLEKEEEENVLGEPINIFLDEDAKERFGRIVSAYVSFMRGENPNSFPVRLYPLEDRLTIDEYPPLNLRTDTEVNDIEKENMTKLPIVISTIEPDTELAATLIAQYEKVNESGLTLERQNMLLGSGNCVFPGGLVGNKGFRTLFPKLRGSSQYTTDDPSWMNLDTLDAYAPKIAKAVRSFNAATGVCFLYSRFKDVGAHITALALEVNGYKRIGGNLLKGVTADPQCAFCTLKKSTHSPSNANHTFTQANYIVLTGDTPKNQRDQLIRAARARENMDGSKIKVIIGSQIAGEGLDFRFLREVHILEAWFHLNKTEQIIGRGIRFNSHMLLSPQYRNCTIFLHALKFAPELSDTETADLYCYRSALQKAIYVGQVSREMKQYAMDCNLRSQVTVIKGFSKRIQIDSHGETRGDRDTRGEEISVDDTPFTAICDWMETCDYTCKPRAIDIQRLPVDESTYDTYGIKYIETNLLKILKTIFNEQPFVQADDLVTSFRASGATYLAIELVLRNVINNKSFRITRGDKEGYITFRNGYILFQPYEYTDIKIPLAIRILNYAVKRDEYTPEYYKQTSDEKKAKRVESTPIGVDKLQTLWKNLAKWIEEAVDRNGDIELNGILSVFAKNKSDYKQTLQAIRDRLTILRLFCNSIGTLKPEVKPLLKKTLSQYVWDEWLSVEEQCSLLEDSLLTGDELDDSVKLVTSNSYVDTDEKSFWYVNAKSNELVKKSPMPGTNPVQWNSEAFSTIEYKGEEIPKLTADVVHAGDPYGFLVPKRGLIVFKTVVPFVFGSKKLKKGDKEKPDRGLECANVSNNTSPAKLKKLGDILRGEQDYKEGKKIPENLQMDVLLLQKAQIDRRTELNNSNSRCTLLDITLRFMDKYLKDQGLRWFYRPVDAFISDHAGIVSPDVQSAAKLQQQEKKREAKVVQQKQQAEKAVKIKAKRQLKAEAAKEQRAAVKAAEQEVVAAAKRGEVPSEGALQVLQQAEAAKVAAEAAKATRAPTRKLKATAAAPRRRTMRQRK